MADMREIGGQRWIYEDLRRRLTYADLASSAANLELAVNGAGEVEIPFLGRIFRVARSGVRRADGQRFPETAGSVLIHYVLNGSRSRPSGQFVTLAELAGPLFKHSSYVKGALERPIVKRFAGRAAELVAAIASLGGALGGEGGLGSISLIVAMLPHIPLQLVFYDRDADFPARATLLFDRHATRLIDFEVLAVLATVFVQFLVSI